MAELHHKDIIKSPHQEYDCVLLSWLECEDGYV